MTGHIQSVAAPLPEDNVDTDVIFPARFLLLLERNGLGRYAFFERRNGTTGFVLDDPTYSNASVLVTGRNFGTGSSREQAVWALADHGIRCIVAASFGEIFKANCFRNGLLPIELEPEPLARVMSAANAAQTVSVDIANGTIGLPGGMEIAFALSDHRKKALIAGLDELGAILANDMNAIADYERWQAAEMPWATIPQDQMAELRADVSRQGRNDDAHDEETPRAKTR